MAPVPYHVVEVEDELSETKNVTIGRGSQVGPNDSWSNMTVNVDETSLPSYVEAVE